jgi:hypothetical protein
MHLEHVLRSGDMLFLRYLAGDRHHAEHGAPGVPAPSKGS